MHTTNHLLYLTVLAAASQAKNNKNQQARCVPSAEESLPHQPANNVDVGLGLMLLIPQ
jgi:hypothetical protein